AQVVKALADVPLFDRDKETLIVSDEAGRNAVLKVMEHYKFQYEEIDLLLLPELSVMYSSFVDYGFESRSGNRYLYTHLISRFRFANLDVADNQKPALMQMDEYLIAQYVDDGQACYAVDHTLKALMDGIAKAYHCSLHWLDLD